MQYTCFLIYYLILPYAHGEPSRRRVAARAGGDSGDRPSGQKKLV